MRRIEWQYNQNKLEKVLWEYIQCLKPHYDKESTKIEITSIVNKVLNDYYK